MIENDFRILEKIDAAPPESHLGFVQLRADIAKTRAEFEAALGQRTE